MEANHAMIIFEVADEDYPKFYRLMGAYYGYPVCCTNSFIRRAGGMKDINEDQKKVHNGKGFIPCQKCARKIVQGQCTIAELIQNRICKTSYPLYGGRKETLRYLKGKITLINMEEVRIRSSKYLKLDYERYTDNSSL